MREIDPYNNPNAYVLERAKRLAVDSWIFNKEQFRDSLEVVDFLKDNKIDLVVLAGFLWLVPSSLVSAFPNAIINIHPALLPKFGGKGMYGDKVHQAVKEAAEIESGISIHFVNEHYDEGTIIAQYKCSLSENDSAETIAKKVHQLEYEFFPKEIEKIALKLQTKKI